MKYSFYPYLLLGFTLLIFTSCNEQKVEQNPKVYFDIEEYISNLKVEDLTYNVQKTVGLNGKKESLELEKYNILPELELMKKYNINKVSLAGKYDVKEVINKDTILTTYIANEEDLATRSLAVQKKGNELISIKISALLSSILSENKQTIIFVPEKSFQLLSEDDNKYNDDLVKEILITF